MAGSEMTVARTRRHRTAGACLGGWLLWLCVLSAVAAGPGHCRDCHESRLQGFAAGHDFAAADCVRCHRGDAAAATEADAHAGLIAFPGDMASASAVCGACHGDEVRSVHHSLMHTGAGMVATTRAVLGGAAHAAAPADLSRLADTPADDLLRKLCAGCHLGQPKERHVLDETLDRGGGCLACHINHYPEDAHPALTVRVADARCFGCHSRSGRISLSYAGLAETGTDAEVAGQLKDGRRIATMTADVHHRGGLGCIDCHTRRGLMGAKEPALFQREGVDIACGDCHDTRARIPLAEWPLHYDRLRRRIPFDVSATSEFPLTRNGTPLWNVELRRDGTWLHRKDGAGVVLIPSWTQADHPLAREHARLDCSACHSQWAPQCYGCHLEYDPDGEQWDHQRHAVTPGRWHERRSGIRNGPPLLGVNADDRIVPVVPGMIMTVTHPDWAQPKFVRRFAALEPHTTGRSRGCRSCHRSPVALGLGEGRLEHTGSGWRFEPLHQALADGLPADAWTSLTGPVTETAAASVRPFSPEEIRRILDTPLP
ncbi:MAG: hypothetical protein PVJ15_04350 [Gammaproteobacteria bacterium]|jgi:hypothetical protein